MATHAVPGEVFDALARGEGDTMGALRVGQRSKRLLLLHQLEATARSRAPRACAEADTAAAYAGLVQAHRGAPAQVDHVLLHPHVGAWASRCLRLLLFEGGLPPGDLGHLGAIAAVAAWRAGQAFEVTTHLRDGSLTLPGLGQVRLGTGTGWCRVRWHPGAGGVELASAGTGIWLPLDDQSGAAAAPALEPEPGALSMGTGWQPLRRVRSRADGVEIDVQVDDLDPYRDCGHLDVAPRLTAAQVQDWQAKLDEAWALLVRLDRARAEAIAAGLTVFVPLRPATQAERSASCRQAAGAVAMSSPGEALALVLALVHEFQHTKLSQLLDLVPLVERSPAADRLLHYAPWRPDPRPLTGLLQGAYAYLGLVGFWDGYRRRPEGSRRHPNGVEDGVRLAHFEFALWRSQVAGALDTLQGSGRLTPEGQRFVAGMAWQLARYRQKAVPPLAGWLARLARLDAITSWRLRNLRTDPDRLGAWAEAWIAGGPSAGSGPDSGPGPGSGSGSGSEEVPTTLVDGTGPPPSQARLALLRHRLGYPTRPPQDGGSDDDGDEDGNAASRGDALLVEGRFVDAADRYRHDIAIAPDDLAAWSGLALVRRVLPTPASEPLARCPERVRGLHRAILDQSGVAPDPDVLAAWLGQASTAANA